MRPSNHRNLILRLLVTFTVAAGLTLAFATSSNGVSGARASAVRHATTASHPDAAAARHRARARTSLESVGSRFVGAPIPIKGSTWRVGQGRHLLVLQRYAPTRHRWVGIARQRVHSGRYQFADQHRWSAGKVRFRTVLYRHRRPISTSNVIRVRVVAMPATITQQHTVSATNCPQLTVTTYVQTRTVTSRWNAAKKSWVQVASSWQTVAGSTSQRPAGVADCVKPVGHVPANAALPDLRIKDLTRCGAGDSAATGGTCFKIVPSAPYNASFPSLTGRKLLKFGVITLNVGPGPGEVVADRSAANLSDWKAYQSFYDAGGNLLGSVEDPNVQFYFAGDGHNHWHVRDFDEYDLLDAGGTSVAVAEKHGYCMQDNTTYGPMAGWAGVPATEVYAWDTSCGQGLPQALTIIHGLSRGWGDTYPTTLPDQAIDITGLPDGVYTVRVHADAKGAVIESNENNNTATVQIQITGDTVTVMPGTSTGGMP